MAGTADTARVGGGGVREREMDDQAEEEHRNSSDHRLGQQGMCERMNYSFENTGLRLGTFRNADDT
jgi:hypothetical protein